jgi:hypothetical protein
MTRIASGVILAAILTALPLVAPSPAPGCAAVPPSGGRVEISDEAALIVWDEASKTEHFIRRANFRSTAAEFGFLVPTPSQPELGEADDGVFDSLAALTAPKIELRHVKRPRPRPRRGEHGEAMAAKGAAMPRSGVEVLDQKQVGGLDAVVLRFHRGGKDDDPAAGAEELAGWLKKHSYEFGPTLIAWLKPYIANDWVMTAFRVAGGKEGPARSGPRGVRGAPVRMSFQTDRPFYPYREPAVEKPPTPTYERRFLRVYFVGAARFEGTLGAGSGDWPGRAAWADKLSDEQVKALAAVAKLPGPVPAGPVWLTEFEDHSSPRPGTDEVYFKPDASQAALARPPIIHEVVEWYDEPEPEREWISESMRLVLLWAVIGIGFLALVGRLLYGVTRRQRDRG